MSFHTGTVDECCCPECCFDRRQPSYIAPEQPPSRLDMQATEDVANLIYRIEAQYELKCDRNDLFLDVVRLIERNLGSGLP